MTTLRGAARIALPNPPSFGSVAESNVMWDISHSCSPLSCGGAAAPPPVACAMGFRNRATSADEVGLQSALLLKRFNFQSAHIN